MEKAAELGLPVKAGKVEYPDAQLEYDLDGRSGRVNVEIATEHYSAKSIGAKAAAAVEASPAIPPHLNSKENSCSPGKLAWD